MLVESKIEPVERLLPTECLNLVVFDRQSVKVKNAIDSFMCAVKLCDGGCKYAMIFVMLLMS